MNFFLNDSMEHPSVAIVILNWNGKSFLQQFLPSVLQSTYPNLKFYVADNASTDGSVKFLKEQYAEVEVILLSENFGFAKGYNLALQQIKTEYFILLNSDVKVVPQWIEPMVSLLVHNPKIAACQPKLLSFSNPQSFEYAGAAGGWLDALGYPFSRGRIFEDCEADQGQYDDASPIFWASGAAFFVRASVFRQVGGFDPYFFAHQEEIDLCWRMQLAGYQIFACPQSVVYHVGGGTLPKGNSLKTFLNYRNNMILLYKNMRFGNWLIVMLLRLMLDVISGFRSLIAGDKGYFLAVIRAVFAFWKWIFSQKRDNVFPADLKSFRPFGLYRGSIVWQYFVKGKKNFSEIVEKE